MNCEILYCKNKKKKEKYCKRCNYKIINKICLIKKCKNKLFKNYQCNFHYKQRSITIEQNKIFYDTVISIDTFICNYNVIYLLYYDYEHYYIYNNKSENIFSIHIGNILYYNKYKLYGPINLEEKNFCFNEELSKINFINLYNLNIPIKEYIIKNNNATIIQKAWRLCRYDPSYKMCSKVQLGELKRLGAL
jgi:hypothetical protein